MEFSIIIPTFDNFKYLKFSLESIKKNSKFNHETIIHVNGRDEDTLKYLNENNIKFTFTDTNVGLCKGVNLAARQSTKKYIVYAHDDMYFCPDWDLSFIEEINNLKTDHFYFSSIQISPNSPLSNSIINHIYYDCGDKIENFNEKKLLNNYKELHFHDLQGSHWAPHIISKKIWDEIGGFSEEFDPGFGSDPDLNMKLWNKGIRIFKGVNKSRVYHFGSLTTRKNNKVTRNNANITFLMKWGITINFFTKNYLKRGLKYNGELKDPKKDLFFLISLFFIKTKYLYLRIIKLFT